MPDTMHAFVAQDSVSAASENTWVGVKASKRGEIVVLNWWTQMALEGRVYNVRAGTITTPIVGDLVITDQNAEMCADAQTGFTIVPAYLNMGIRLGTGILHEYAAKSVGSISTAGTAFIPLPLQMGGPAAATTARAAAAGAVTVTAELATTTTRLWSYSNPLAVAAGHDITYHEWAPTAPPTLVGPSCFYVQIAASGTGPSYYANFDYVELTTNSVS